MGATVEYDYPGVYQVVAPMGKWWFESASPHLRVDWVNAGGHVDASMKSDAIQDAIDRMKSGYIKEEE